MGGLLTRRAEVYCNAQSASSAYAKNTGSTYCGVMCIMAASLAAMTGLVMSLSWSDFLIKRTTSPDQTSRPKALQFSSVRRTWNQRCTLRVRRAQCGWSRASRAARSRSTTEWLQGPDSGENMTMCTDLLPTSLSRSHSSGKRMNCLCRTSAVP